MKYLQSILAALMVAMSVGAVPTTKFKTDNSGVHTYDEYIPWGNKTITHSATDIYKIVDGVVYMNTSTLIIDGVPYDTGSNNEPLSIVLPAMNLSIYPQIDLSFMDAFTPPDEDVPAVIGSPEIAEYTRETDSGDTMILTGESFSSFTGGAEGRDTRFVTYGNNILTDTDIQRLDGQHVSVTLNTSLPANEVYLMWPHNNNGYGYPIAINKADAWWVTDRVSVGDTFTTYGRNLMLGAGNSRVWCEEEDEWVISSSGNPYAAKFIVPAGWSNGIKTLWVHNGKGRAYGWSDNPIEINVVTKTIWSGATYNVKTYGAIGNGIADDTAAIDAAVDAAKNNYGTVYFPAGTYSVSDRFTAYNKKVRYLGDGMDLTTINPHSSWALGENFLHPGGNDIKFEKLTLAANQYGGDVLIHMRNHSRIDFEQVRFSQLESNNSNTSLGNVDFHNSSYIRFIDCEFILTGLLFMGSGEQIQVTGCDFYGINDNNTQLATWGGKEISISGCTGQSYDNSNPLSGAGWCKGRFFHALGVWGATHEIYFGGNETFEMTPRDASGVDQNSGEQFMTEGEYVKWRANATAATANTVTLSGLNSGSGDIITIVDGRGIGQSREIISVISGVVTVDSPWTVVPDTSSVLVTGTYTRRVTVYNNIFEGTDRAVNNPTHIAATAIEPFGGAVDWIVANNTMTKLRSTIAQFSIYKDKLNNGDQYVCPPHYFNIYQDNIIDDCREGITIIGYHEQRGSGAVIVDPSFAGMVYRNNIIVNMLERAISTDETISEGSYAITVFDKNTISTDKKCVVDETDGLENYIWVGNTFSGVAAYPGMSIASDHTPVLHNNTWNGFSTIYGGTPPGAVLEIPVRYVEATSSSGNIAIWNSGTANLTWSAVESSSWLTLTKSSGSIANESTIDTMTYDIASPPTVGSEAIITITGGGTTKDITIVYIGSSN